jgi:hypothetical protein
VIVALSSVWSVLQSFVNPVFIEVLPPVPFLTLPSLEDRTGMDFGVRQIWL